MRKKFVWITYCLLIALVGCGSESSDPTARIDKLEADPTEVAPGGSVIIKAQVVKAGGESTPAAGATTTTTTGQSNAWGVNVTFRLLTANGGRLSALTQETDGSGVATVVYTAGNNYSQDIIQATLENGNSLSLIIKKTGTLTGASISSFVASPTTVAEGQTSVITAKVTDGNSSNPMKDEAVTFTVATNESGGCLINATNACVNSVTVYSDTSGNAVAVYRAGGNSSDAAVYDTVRGALTNGSSNAAVITRSAGTTSSAVLALAASPTTVSGGQTSVITATVTGGTNSGADEAVTLIIPVNNSGATFLNASGASVAAITITTGSGGAASAIYQAGTNAAGTSVQDTVQGVLSNGALSAVSITVNPGVSGAVLALAASPTSVNSGQTSVITATVTGGTNSGANETVTLTLPVNNSGAGFLNSTGASVARIAITTGSGGTASAIYQAGTNAAGTSVQDTVQGVLSNGALNAVMITRNAGVAGYIVIVTANPVSVKTGSISLVTANVKDNTNAVVIGTPVTFTWAGTGRILPLVVTTDGAGNAGTNFTAEGAGGTNSSVTATVTIGGSNYTGIVNIATTP